MEYLKRNGAILTLSVYTILNLKLLYLFLVNSNYVIGAVLQNGGMGFLGIALSLFLNTALILYFLKIN